MSNEQLLEQFKTVLYNEEKSAATVSKYLHDARVFLEFLQNRPITKEAVIAYKQSLTLRYAPASVNSMLVACNRFLAGIGRGACRVKLLKIQRRIFRSERRELSEGEYRRIVRLAREGGERLMVQTICETGIRVSELCYITAEAVERGRAEVRCKGKDRVILLPSALRRALLAHMKKAGIRAGCLFMNRKGMPIGRCQVWRILKRLGNRAGIAAEKVFPHNLRHLFARTFYEMDHDIVRLSDLLGHSSIETTRIYTMESGREHQSCLERLHGRLVT